MDSTTLPDFAIAINNPEGKSRRRRLLFYFPGVDSEDDY